MLAFSPALFATVLTGAIRLGKEAHEARVKSLALSKDIRWYIPDAPRPNLSDPVQSSDYDVQAWVVDIIKEDLSYRPGEKYDGVFLCQPDQPDIIIRDERNRPRINPLKRHLIEQAIEDVCSEKNQNTSRREIRNSIITFHTRDWANRDRPTPWGIFFQHMLDVSFDVLAVQPGLLGMGHNLEAFFTALIPNIADAYEAEATDSNRLMRDLAETFGEAAIKSLADNPGIITNTDKWHPLITGILEPIKKDVESGGVSQLVAEGRIRTLLSGPIAYGALTALAEHPDDFLKGEFAKDSIPGLIIRDTLGVIASSTHDGFTVRDFFSAEAALTVMGSALRVAKKNPKLFVKEGRFTDQGTEHGRQLLTIFAETFLKAPKPFSFDKDLAVTLACNSLDVMADYTEARLAVYAGDDAHKKARAEMGAHLIRDLLKGFDNRLQGEKVDLLETVFSRPQLIDVMQILASHIAKSPHHFISDDTNPQVVAIAEAVALAISEDESGLLSGSDWTEILTIAMDVALKNPGRLFSLTSDDPKQSVALALISRILKSARDGMNAQTAGNPAVLFGQTLSEAIRITLTASASSALSLIRDPAVLESHLDEVTKLAARLNTLAGSDDPQKVISADDWIAIYGFYIVNILENGPGYVDDLSDEKLLSALTDGMITLEQEETT